MDRNFHRFRSAWDVEAAPSLAYSVLERFTEYPAWWPEIRHLRLVGEEACEVICRSVTASPTGHGSQMVFDEEVVVVKPLLRRLGPIARPAMRANHILMMRYAKRGLATRLAGIDEAGGDMAPWSPRPTSKPTREGPTMLSAGSDPTRRILQPDPGSAGARSAGRAWSTVGSSAGRG
jgi:hypothetical protein